MRAIEGLADIPRINAAARPEAVAILCEDRRLTYGELHRRSRRTAALLMTLGAQPGQRVAWLGRSHEAFFELLFGAAEARACLAPINSRLAIPEIAFILDDSTADLFFVTGDFLAAAQAVLAQVDRPIRLIAVDGAGAGLDDYATLRDAAAAGAAREPVAADDVLQLYTSGTTGLPKGVRLSNANMAAFLEIAMTFEGLDFEPDDTMVQVMPLFHVGGANPALAVLAGGARLVLVPVFDPPAVLKVIEAERATRIGFVPAMINMLLQHPTCAEIDFSAVRTLVYGASPISEAVLNAARARIGCRFIQMYGMTESNAAGTILNCDDHRPELLRSCGRAWPTHEVRIADEAGAELPPGEVGEIQIRGPAVMSGYWNRPEATAETITPEGWLKTGDAGHRDADGYVFVYDRVKDMIVSGGENVYPAEVENAILGCPGVADAAVIGVPDPRWGEAVKAVVVRAPGAEIDSEVVIAWARQRIAGYKAPKSVDFIEVLPRNATNKVLRRVLREPYWAGHGRLVG
ncbi:long-chain-fatty-acid--CoA ligase [Phenylobacterium sp.]|uniref:long-chain-fatty-acid--CoA ligase n=1 Tax=Phenylobacterium sp. TaxID=1871053 RepID=UPI0012274841|nr:long-chain-fatty-acid--CoA ligase [Phenylobacterium sp.]THD62563.1 MAG: long-chain-fatty-acid--CoA ligase [Phenylobacterium sp.]